MNAHDTAGIVLSLQLQEGIRSSQSSWHVPLSSGWGWEMGGGAGWSGQATEAYFSFLPCLFLGLSVFFMYYRL